MNRERTRNVKQIYGDLWQTSAEHPLSQFPNSKCHAYLLIRDSGNVLFHSTGREAVGQVNDRADHDRIEERGGVSHILLAHWHEASPSTCILRERFWRKEYDGLEVDQARRIVYRPPAAANIHRHHGQTGSPNRHAIISVRLVQNIRHVIPGHIRSDNGSELVAMAVQEWITAVGAQTAYIEPGSTWENGYVESFNARLRDELVNGEIFYSLREAQIIIESWRRHYLATRPHASLRYRPPAPEVFVPAFAARPASLHGAAPPAGKTAIAKFNIRAEPLNEGRSLWW